MNWFIAVLIAILIILITLRYIRISTIASGHKGRLAIIGGKKNEGKRLVFGFFHPFCDTGGGAEKVLWATVHTLLTAYSDAICVIYSGDIVMSKQDLINTVKVYFKIPIDESRVELCRLRRKFVVEDKWYKLMVLLLRNIGSVYLCHEALSKCYPDMFIDSSMAYTFTYPMVKWIYGIPVVAYIHFPIASADCLKTAKQEQNGFNNQRFLTMIPMVTQLRSWYNHSFVALYNTAGLYADVMMANSTWTRDHLRKRWFSNHEIPLVHPPCDIQKFVDLPLSNRNPYIIVSFGQFRPEKNQVLQLDVMWELVYRLQLKQMRLVMVGSALTDDNKARVDWLQKRCVKMGLQEHVEIVMYTSDLLLDIVSKAAIGLNTTEHETFGIAIVELMAAGLIPLVHASGGPPADVVIPYKGLPTGFCAKSKEEYSDIIHSLVHLSETERLELQQNARCSVFSRFGEDRFSESFLRLIKPLMPSGDE